MSALSYTTNVTPVSIGVTEPGDIFLTRATGLSGQTEDIKMAPVAYGTVGFDSTGALQVTLSPVLRSPVSDYTASGAIALTSGTHYINKTGSLAAMTVAAPSSQDGTRITIISTTAFAHTVTFTGGTLNDGVTGGGKTTVTLKAFAGSSFTFEAKGSSWYLIGAGNVTSIA